MRPPGLKVGADPEAGFRISDCGHKNIVVAGLVGVGRPDDSKGEIFTLKRRRILIQKPRHHPISLRYV
jgi:hypothetical protein